MTGELQTNASFLRDGRMIRCMSQQNAGARRIDCNFGQDRAEVLCVRRVFVRNANELQTIELDLLIVKDANARSAYRIQKMRDAPKEFVIAVNEMRTERYAKMFPRLRDFKGIHMGAVEHVSSNENNVRIECCNLSDDPFREASMVNVAEVKVRCEYGRAASPGVREIFKFH